MAWIGGAIAGVGSLASGVLGSSASKKAAGQSSQAQIYAAQLAYNMYQQTAQRLQPFVDTGVAANKQLGGYLGLPGYEGAAPGGQFGMGTKPFAEAPPQFTPFNPTTADVENLPGFKPIRDLGIQATTNAEAAMGLGKSGSLLKGIDQFTTALTEQDLGQMQGWYMQNYQQQASSYQQRFSNYWSQLGQIYNMLTGASQQGGNAAAQVGSAGTATASTAGNFLSGAGTSQAAGTIGSASALQQPLNTISGLGGQLALLNAMGFSGGAGGAGGTSLFGGGGIPGRPVGSVFTGGNLTDFSTTGIPVPTSGVYPGGFSLGQG